MQLGAAERAVAMQLLQAILAVPAGAVDSPIGPRGRLPQIRDDEPRVVARLAPSIRARVRLIEGRHHGRVEHVREQNSLCYRLVVHAAPPGWGKSLCQQLCPPSGAFAFQADAVTRE